MTERAARQTRSLLPAFLLLAFALTASSTGLSRPPAELPLSTVAGGQGQTYGWARVLTRVKDPRMNVTFDRAYYSDIITFPSGADLNSLKSQISDYFARVAVPSTQSVLREQANVKEVLVQTYPTLAEADAAEYAMAGHDKTGLNAGSHADLPAAVSYFDWDYYGHRRELFPGLSQFAETGENWKVWSYVVFETSAQRQGSGRPVSEKRYYISQPFEVIMTGSESNNLLHHLDDYFTTTVVQPAKRNGVTISYYRESIREVGTSFETYERALAERNKYADAIKHNGDTQYDFFVSANAATVGEAVSKAACIANCTGPRAPVSSTR